MFFAFRSILSGYVMLIRDVLKEAIHAFETSGIPTARLDAEVLLSFYLNRDRLEFLKNPTLTINEQQITGFRSIISRRLQGEPVAYITRRKEFWTFSLEVNGDVLIPRPDTEIIVEEALDICRRSNITNLRILDIGTGSGAIALALASELTSAVVVATDISEGAVAQAKKNASALHLEERIDFRQGDWFEPVEGVFDIIISNPPYIAEEEYKRLPDGVRKYEPSIALLAGKKGTEFHEKLIHQAIDFLKKKGWLLLEIGAKQENAIRGLMDASGCYENITMRRDYSGLPRVMRARRKIIG